MRLWHGARDPTQTRPRDGKYKTLNRLASVSGKDAQSMERIKEKIISLSATAGKAARLHEQGLHEDRDDAWIRCCELLDEIEELIGEAIATDCHVLPN